MTRNVKKATPEFATSKTFVWWDMDSCPLPNGYDPSRVGPRIDTELKNLGYNGPLTIIANGNLEGVPLDFLKALSSGGVVIKQLSLGSHMIYDVLDAFSPSVPPPLSMMIITAAHADLLEDVVYEFFHGGPSYNLLLAYPAVTEHADPEPSSLLVDNFGGQLVWDRLGLLKDQGSARNDTRRQETGCESHCCGLCDFSSDSFDDFATHLTTLSHEVEMRDYLSYLAEKRQLEVENLKDLEELDEPYREKVEAKRQEFIEFANDIKRRDSYDDTPKTKKSKRSLKIPKLQSTGKKFMLALLCKPSSLKKKSTAKPKKLSKLKTADEAECSS